MGRARFLSTAALLLLVACPLSAGETLSQEELFQEAKKVVLGKVVHYGEEEAAPGSLPHAKYRYQAIWFRESEVFKGPPAPERFGYEVVLLPIRTKRYGLANGLTALVDISNTPPDRDLVLHLRPDQVGAWTLVAGRYGIDYYPNGERLAQLRRWKKAPPKKKAPPGK